MQVTHYNDTSQRVQASWRDYVDLIQLRSSLLLAIPAVAAFVVAAGEMPSLVPLTLTILGGMIVSSGANAFNCYLDADLDGVIKRTQFRAIPAQRISPNTALDFSIALTILGFLVLWLGVGLLPAVLALAGVILYIGVYTLWMKRRTPNSILAGGAAAAMPVLVGWAGATGDLSVGALVLASIVFYWAPPHYWSLAMVEQREHLRVGLPTMAVIKGSQTSRIQIGRYSVLMAMLTLLPVGLGMANVFYALFALVLGTVFVVMAAQLMLRPSSKRAWELHKFSTLYLALLFVALIADQVIFF